MLNVTIHLRYVLLTLVKKIEYYKEYLYNILCKYTEVLKSLTATLISLTLILHRHRADYMTKGLEVIKLEKAE